MAYLIQESSKKNCVLVSLANYFGKSYDDCVIAATKAGYSQEYIEKNGTPTADVPVIIAHLTGRIPRVHKPRRGQNNITGLGCFDKPGNYHHMAPIINGVVYDTNGVVLGIECYKRWHGYTLKYAYSQI